MDNYISSQITKAATKLLTYINCCLTTDYFRRQRMKFCDVLENEMQILVKHLSTAFHVSDATTTGRLMADHSLTDDRVSKFFFYLVVRK